MKLLGWMHQKIRQHSAEPFRDFTLGNCSSTCLSAQPSLDDPLFYPKPSHCSKPFKQNHSECQLSISELDSKKVEDVEEVLDAMPEFFHGFLAIGTLGSKPILSEPPTPTFGVPSENILEMETEVTDRDLRVINDELDKFLEAEAKEEGCDESSARNSYVSVITLSSKQIEGDNAKEYGNIEICPLQGYLFGSSIELPDSRIEAKKEKASLRELFQMTKTVEEYSKLNCDRGNKEAKGKFKSAVPLMKKMLKKLQTSSGGCTKSAESDASHSVSTKNKIHKVLRMFHKKVHPESSRVAEEFKRSKKHEINNTLSQSNHSGYDNEDSSLYEDNIEFPQGSGSVSKGVQCHGYISSLSQNRVSSSSFGGNGEHWIKTDADYLVLEL